MKNRRFFSIVNLVIYLLFIICGTALVFSMIYLINNHNAEGFEVIGIVLSALIFMFIGGAYAVVGIIPAILRFISIFKSSIAFPIICFPFDLLFLLFSLALTVGALTGGVSDFKPALIIILTAALSLASLAFNITDLIFRKRYAAAKRRKIKSADATQVTSCEA